MQRGRGQPICRARLVRVGSEPPPEKRLAGRVIKGFWAARAAAGRLDAGKKIVYFGLLLC